MYYNGGMRIYTAKRGDTSSEGGAQVYVDGTLLALEPSLEVRSHSPTGFEWGYAGSGPSQLALAILLDLFPKSVAQRYYQAFKYKFLVPAPQEGFVITSLEIESWLKEEIKLTGGSDNAV